MHSVLILHDLPGHLGIVPSNRLPAVLPKPFVSDELPGYWVPVLSKVPVPKVFVLDDLPGHLRFINHH